MPNAILRKDGKIECRQIQPIQAIGRSEDSEALYSAESKTTDAINRAAVELGKLMGHSKKEYWTKTIPQALIAVLCSFETKASIAAAVSYLIDVGVLTEPPAILAPDPDATDEEPRRADSVK